MPLLMYLNCLPLWIDKQPLCLKYSATVYVYSKPSFIDQQARSH